MTPPINEFWKLILSHHEEHGSHGQNMEIFKTVLQAVGCFCCLIHKVKSVSHYPINTWKFFIAITFVRIYAFRITSNCLILTSQYILFQLFHLCNCHFQSIFIFSNQCIMEIHSSHAIIFTSTSITGSSNMKVTFFEQCTLWWGPQVLSHI
jgi:hypothetical protein